MHPRLSLAGLATSDGYRDNALRRQLPDDDTIRTWYRLYEENGIEGLASFGYEGGACRLSEAQQCKLAAWITETLPRTTREVGAWIKQECGHRLPGPVWPKWHDALLDFTV
jgi:hypothetical protein